MLLESNNFIPQVYRKERDIQVFSKLLDIILNCCKFDIDNLGCLYDSLTCPELFLPLLAKTVNYNYNFEDTVTANRRIIKVFVDMEKWRGSRTGLLIAAALSLTSTGSSENNNEISPGTDFQYMDALRNLKINIDYETGTIKIDYPGTYEIARNLIDYVRPIGMWTEWRVVNDININPDAMLIYADIENMTKEYMPEIDSFVSKSFVNLSTTGDKTFKEQLEDFVNSLNITNNTLDLGGGA